MQCRSWFVRKNSSRFFPDQAPFRRLKCLLSSSGREFQSFIALKYVVLFPKSVFTWGSDGKFPFLVLYPWTVEEGILKVSKCSGTFPLIALWTSTHRCPKRLFSSGIQHRNSLDHEKTFYNPQFSLRSDFGIPVNGPFPICIYQKIVLYWLLR